MFWILSTTLLKTINYGSKEGKINTFEKSVFELFLCFHSFFCSCFIFILYDPSLLDKARAGIFGKGLLFYFFTCKWKATVCPSL